MENMIKSVTDSFHPIYAKPALVQGFYPHERADQLSVKMELNESPNKSVSTTQIQKVTKVSENRGKIETCILRQKLQRKK